MSLQIFTQRILPIKDKLFRFAYSLLQHREESEDVVQEVMIKIWDKREEWPKWQNLEGYCMIMMRNASLDKLRSKKQQAGNIQQAERISSLEKNPFEQMAGKETLQRIRLCMENLPEKQQLAIQLREIEGKSYQEIAEALNMTMEQVKANIFRARNTIKNELLKQETTWTTIN